MYPEENNDRNIATKHVYFAEDINGFEVSKPGIFPYTRGIQPNMYNGKLWTMRQYAGFATAEETNERYKYLLQQGTTGLSVAFDLPTQIGYDTDHQMAQGECGKVGVAIDSLSDMEILFDKIPLDKVSTSMTINAPASVLLAMYACVAEKQDVTLNKLSGTIQNDILKEYIARGTYIFPPEQSMRLITDIFDFCGKEIPKWNTISISGYHIREAGSTAIQEIAFTLADGIAYVEAAKKTGQDPNVFGERLSFFFNAHNNFIEEIAKYRAARKIWAYIMKDRFGVTNPKARMLRFHTQTAGCTLTAQQPENNIIRVTLQALASVLGGTQSLHTNSMDEALALPTEKSVQTALRTQQIIAYESEVSSIVDPFAGSYAVEKITSEIEVKVWKYIEKIDNLGGMLKAISSGYVQKEIQTSAYEYQKTIESSERIIVGVNKFTVREEVEPELLTVNPEVEKQQVAKLNKVRSERDNIAVQNRLLEIREALKDTSINVMPKIIEAVRVYATEGEICQVMREEFGKYTENIAVLNLSAPIIDTTKTSEDTTSNKTRIIIAKPGLDGHDRGAKVIAQSLRDAGMEVIYTGLRQTPEQIVNTALQEDADFIGISILSGAHNFYFNKIIDLLKERDATDIKVFGGGVIPKKDIQALLDIGVGAIFGPGTLSSIIIDWIKTES